MSKSPSHNPDQCALAWRALRLAHRAVERNLETALGDSCRLSLHEFDALLAVHLAKDAGCRIQDLVGPVPLSQPALSRLISRLEERGLIKRESDMADGRVTLICLTNPGAELIERAIKIQASTIQATLTGHLDTDQQATLLEVLARIAPLDS